MGEVEELGKKLGFDMGEMEKTVNSHDVNSYKSIGENSSVTLQEVRTMQTEQIVQEFDNLPQNQRDEVIDQIRKKYGNGGAKHFWTSESPNAIVAAKIAAAEAVGIALVAVPVTIGTATVIILIARSLLATPEMV